MRATEATETLESSSSRRCLVLIFSLLKKQEQILNNLKPQMDLYVDFIFYSHLSFSPVQAHEVLAGFSHVVHL